MIRRPSPPLKHRYGDGHAAPPHEQVGALCVHSQEGWRSGVVRKRDRSKPEAAGPPSPRLRPGLAEVLRAEAYRWRSPTRVVRFEPDVPASGGGGPAHAASARFPWPRMAANAEPRLP